MCTGIKLIAQNNAVLCGRTLEFATVIDSDIVVIPRDYCFTGTAPSGESTGLQWKARYAAVGANASGISGIIDGLNEKGLAGGLFYFPGYARFQHVAPEHFSHSIAPWELLTWILTSFSTVQEVKEHVPRIKVGNTVFAPWGIVPPVHAIIHDSRGHSLVIEYINGDLIMVDNPLGIFTNAPSFDWHLTNLNNYINLSTFNVGTRTLNDITLSPLGQGSGMLGLPGDFTSPSRFIRAAAYKASVVAIPDEDSARKAAFHILNLFDIPYGSVREKEDNVVHYEYTQWTSVSDLKKGRYYINTYDNRTVQMADLRSMNLDAKDMGFIKLHNQEVIIKLTNR